MVDLIGIDSGRGLCWVEVPLLPLVLLVVLTSNSLSTEEQ